MKLEITFLLFLVSITNQQDEYKTGCKSEGSQCQQKCDDGYQLCDAKNKIRCEYGYFKLNFNNESYCVKCPQSFIDKMIYSKINKCD